MKTKNEYMLPVSREAIIQINKGEKGSPKSHIDWRKTKYKYGDERQAIDFFCPEGTKIFAAQDGEVVWIKNDFEKGGLNKKYIAKANGLTIRHTNGEYTNYLHLQKGSIPIKPGDKVKKGDLIGKVGMSGWTPAPHLHFSVFRIYGPNPQTDYETLEVDFKELK